MTVLLDPSASTRTFFNMRPTGPTGDSWDRSPADRLNVHPYNPSRSGDHFTPRSVDPSSQQSSSTRMAYGTGPGFIGTNAAPSGFGSGSGDLPNSGAPTSGYQPHGLDAPMWAYHSSPNAGSFSHMGGSSTTLPRPPMMSLGRPVSTDSMTGSGDQMAGYHQSAHPFGRPQSASGLPPHGYGSGHGLASDLSPTLPSSYEGPGSSHPLGSGMVSGFSGSSSYPPGPYGSMGDGDPRYTTSIHSMDSGPYYSSELPRGAAFMNPYEVKHRRRTTKAQFRVLEDTFQKTPKPTAEVRRAISEQLDMPARAVQIWFQNRRAKAKNAAKRAAVTHSSSSRHTEGGLSGGRPHSVSDPTGDHHSSSSPSASSLKRESDTPFITSPNVRLGSSTTEHQSRPPVAGVTVASGGPAFWGSPGVPQGELDQHRWR